MRPALTIPLVAISLVLSIPLLNLYAQPSPLAEVQEQIKRSTQKEEARDTRELLGAKWFTPGANFTSIFIEKNGAKLLLDWVGRYPQDFLAGGETILRGREYIGIQKEFRDKVKREYRLVIMVPHPKYTAMADMKLLKDIARLEPPALPVSVSEDLTLQDGNEGTLYFIKGGGISLLIKGNKGCRFSVYMPKGVRAADITSFTSQLDINRLWRKLDS